MPLTPFHLGPALAAKAGLRHAFSLRVFVLAQVLIDVESALRLALPTGTVHGPLHSLAGAAAAGLAAAVVGKPLVHSLTMPLRTLLARVEGMPAWVVEQVVPVGWTAALVGGLFGGVSHALLDAVIHADVQPFWPFTARNPFLREGSFYPMHMVTALVGLLGGAAWLALARRTPREGR